MNIPMRLFERFRSRTVLPFKERFDWNWERINFNRIALVNLLCASKLDGSYLEIGCQGNNLFNSVPMLSKIGVDPESEALIEPTAMISSGRIPCTST